MPKFKVTATMYTDLETVIEAKNEEEAYQIAQQLDGAEFTEQPNSGDWQIGDVIKLEEDQNNDQ